MSDRRRRPTRGRHRARSSDRRPTGFWREPAELEVVGDVAPAADPTAMLRSLGPPPLPGQGDVAGQHYAAVAARAAALATALAAAAGILNEPPDDP